MSDNDFERNLVLHDTFVDNGELYHLVTCSLCNQRYKFYGFCNDIINNHITDFPTEEAWYEAKIMAMSGHPDNIIIMNCGAKPRGNVPYEWVNDDLLYQYAMILNDLGWSGYVQFNRVNPELKYSDIMCKSCFNDRDGVILEMH